MEKFKEKKINSRLIANAAPSGFSVCILECIYVNPDDAALADTDFLPPSISPFLSLDLFRELHILSHQVNVSSFFLFNSSVIFLMCLTLL